jgi:hypothetical protein
VGGYRHDDGNKPEDRNIVADGLDDTAISRTSRTLRESS